MLVDDEFRKRVDRMLFGSIPGLEDGCW